MQNIKQKKLLVFCNPIMDSSCKVNEIFLSKHKLKKGATMILSREKMETLKKELTVIKNSCGGCGMNVARWIGSMGGSVAVVGQAGDDKKYDLICEFLKKCSVKNKCIVKPGENTTEVYSCITPDAERTFFCAYGASSHKFYKPLDFNILKNYEIILFEGYQFEFQEVAEELKSLVEKSHQMGKKIVFVNANIFSVPHYANTIRGIMDKFNIITGTKEEFSNLFGIEKFESLLTFLEDSKYELCAVTMGEEGCYLVHKGKRIFVPAPEVENVVDTTGAGDSFTAGLLYGYLNEWTIDDCAKLANFCAKKMISQIGVGVGPEIKEEMQKYITNTD